MAFTNKQISLTFTLGTGSFGEAGDNQVTVTGLRISAKIVKTGYAGMSMCELRVFGLPPTVYNSLVSIYSTPQYAQRNTIAVSAGDSSTAMSQVFIGQIQIAQIDLNSQPNSILTVVAQSCLLQALQPTVPLSYPEGISIASTMNTIAGVMGLRFENNGVTGILPKQYLPGTPRQQALTVIKASGIKWNGGDDGVLAIWPATGSRTSLDLIPTISYEDDLIGYPSYSNIGIGIKTRYNPNVQYGGQVTLVSSLKVTGMNGNWTVYGLAHTLESEMPDGQWMTEIQGANYSLLGAPTPPSSL
jgi:hypothetical protein